MNVKTLIEVLSKEVKKPDRENSEIEFWYNNQQLEIESMSGFAISPDIVVSLKRADFSNVKPLIVKKEHNKQVRKKIQEISKDLLK
jgi:hypothetical protein